MLRLMKLTAPAANTNTVRTARSIRCRSTKENRPLILELSLLRLAVRQGAVDEHGAAGDHALAGFQAVEHFDHAAAGAPGFIWRGAPASCAQDRLARHARPPLHTPPRFPAPPGAWAACPVMILNRASMSGFSNPLDWPHRHAPAGGGWRVDHRRHVADGRCETAAADRRARVTWPGRRRGSAARPPRAHWPPSTARPRLPMVKTAPGAGARDRADDVLPSADLALRDGAGDRRAHDGVGGHALQVGRVSTPLTSARLMPRMRQAVAHGGHRDLRAVQPASGGGEIDPALLPVLQRGAVAEIELVLPAPRWRWLVPAAPAPCARWPGRSPGRSAACASSVDCTANSGAPAATCSPAGRTPG